MVHPLRILPLPYLHTPHFPPLPHHTHTHTHTPYTSSQVPLNAGVELWISSLLSSLRSSLHQLLMSAITPDRGSFSLEECVHHNVTQVATMTLYFHWTKECELVRTAAKYLKATTEQPSSLLPPLSYVLLLFRLLLTPSLFSPPLLSPPLIPFYYPCLPRRCHSVGMIAEPFLVREASSVHGQWEN